MFFKKISLYFIGQICVAKLVWNWNYFSDHRMLVLSKRIRHVAKQSTRVVFFHEILLLPVSSWLCHIDDDIYVNLKVLVKTLAVFDPKTEPIYFGRAGTEWGKARQVSENSTIGRPGQRYHFAVGGMYCLSRAMLERAKPYLV